MSATHASPTTTVQIRPLTARDLAHVMEIERASFSTPWRANTFEDLLRRPDADLFAAVAGDRLVGYAVSWTVADQAELGNVAITGAARGTGIGRRLVETVLERVRQRGAAECFLEVRESNTVARTLYESCGFTVIGRRPRYYSRPVEDAMVMRKGL